MTIDSQELILLGAGASVEGGMPTAACAPIVLLDEFKKGTGLEDSIETLQFVRECHDFCVNGERRHAKLKGETHARYDKDARNIRRRT